MLALALFRLSIARKAKDETGAIVLSFTPACQTNCEEKLQALLEPMDGASCVVSTVCKVPKGGKKQGSGAGGGASGAADQGVAVALKAKKKC